MKRLEIAIIAILKLTALACAAYGELPAGTILISRNQDESQNTSPGHWNHLAIVSSETPFTTIVEAQAGQGVIKTPLSVYLKRPYEPVQCLVPCDRAAGQRAATKAESYVGLPYSKLGSILRVKARRLQRGEKPSVNCVVPVKAAYWAEDRRARRVKIPDDVLKLANGLLDLPRPLAEVLKPQAPPAIPPTEHSVLATPRTERGYYGNRIVNLGFGNYLDRDWSKQLYLENDVRAFGWKRYEWKEPQW